MFLAIDGLIEELFADTENGWSVDRLCSFFILNISDGAYQMVYHQNIKLNIWNK